MAVGGVLIPTLTDSVDFRRRIADSEAETTADEEAAEAAHARTVEELRAGIADTEADEDDLSAHLHLLRSSQAQFELYEDHGESWRWRLRHENSNVHAYGRAG